MADETNIVSPNQPTVDAPETPTNVETQAPNINASVEAKNASEGEQTHDSNTQYRLVEKDGQRVLEVVNGKPAEDTPQENELSSESEPAESTEEPTEPTVTETAQQVGEELNTEPAPYSIGELAQAIATGQVDERRVPKSHKAQYENWRLNQAVKEYNAQRQAEHQRQQQALAAQQLTPEQQQAQMQEFLKNVDVEASKRAAVDAGLSPDEVENLDLMDDDDDRKITYKMAKEWRRAEINQALQRKYNEELNRRQQQAAIYQSINDFTVQAQTSEPHFDEINKLMATRVNDLSYKRAVEIVPVLQALQNGTITEAQTAKLRDYYEDTRKAFYASKNNLSTKPKVVKQPPVVEKPGTGEQLKSTYKPDYNALRNSDSRGRINWLREYFQNKQ